MKRIIRAALLAATPALFLAVMVSAARPAHAEDLELELAKKHFAQGSKLFDAGKYADAVKEFKEAYKLKQLPLLLYNIGFTYDKLNDKTLAEHYYEKFLTDAPAGTANIDIAKARLPDLKKEIEAEDAAVKPPAGDGGKPAGDGGKPAGDGGKPPTGSKTVEPNGETEHPEGASEGDGGKPKKHVKPAPEAPPHVAVTEFQHKMIEDAALNYPLDVSMQIPDDMSVQATLYYRVQGANFQPVPFRQRYNEYIARIPKAAMHGSTVQYYIEVTDKSTGKSAYSSGRAGSPNVIMLDEAVKPHYYNDIEDDKTTAHAQEGDGGEGEEHDHEGPAGKGHPHGKTRFRIWKWVAAGAAVAMLGTGIVYNRMAASRASDVEALADGMNSWSKARGLADQGVFYQGMSNGFLIGGLVVAGGATALFLLDKPVREKAKAEPPPDEDKDALAPRYYAAPMLSPGTVGAAGGVEF